VAGVYTAGQFVADFVGNAFSNGITFTTSPSSDAAKTAGEIAGAAIGTMAVRMIFRYCEELTGRANVRPTIGSVTKRSKVYPAEMDSFAALAMTGIVRDSGSGPEPVVGRTFARPVGTIPE
jgi:hypothetical protein